MNVNIQNDYQQPEVHPLGEPISFTSKGQVKSRCYEDEWDFLGTEIKANGKKANVSFYKTNPIYKRAIQDTLFGLFSLYKEKNAQEPSSSQLSAWKLGLQHIANALGSTQWADINHRHLFRGFKVHLKKVQLGKSTLLNNILVALNQLFDAGVINRIVDSSELVPLARSHKVDQHIAIPIVMYQKLLSRVISVVETYHPYRHEIARVMGEAYDIQARINRGENLLKNVQGERSFSFLSKKAAATSSRINSASRLLINHDIPEFDIRFDGSQLGLLQYSCEMVVLAFSGVRIGEMVSFNEKSYSIIKTDVCKEISVLTGKTSKGSGGIPTTEVWQTHPIAKDALELAYETTSPLRAIYKVKIESMFKSEQLNIDSYQHALKEVESAFIPLKPSVQKNTFVGANMARAFDRLMKIFDIRATSEDVNEFNLLNPSREGALIVGGYLPKLTPHDFRRSFAVFFKRYGFGTTSSIKFQYKHENINMSDYYANNAELMRMHDVLVDSDLLQLMEEEGISLGVDIYHDIYNQSEHLSGIGGERIAQDKFKKMKAGHHVYMSRVEIESLVRNGSLSAVQLPTGGYCTNGECERICGMGLFIGEKKKCIHSVNTDKTAKEMARQRKRLISKFQGLNIGDTFMVSILVGIKQKIKEIELMLVQHEIKYVAFEDNVEGLINVET